RGHTEEDTGTPLLCRRDDALHLVGGGNIDAHFETLLVPLLRTTGIAAHLLDGIEDYPALFLGLRQKRAKAHPHIADHRLGASTLAQHVEEAVDERHADLVELHIADERVDMVFEMPPILSNC